MDLHRAELKEQIQIQELQSFLELNNLPFKDIKLNGNFFLAYYDEAGNVVGSGGIEIYGDAALLRSVAVRATERGMSLGKQIVDDVLQHARELKILSVFLLTETAHDFFLKKGFKDISRDDVPAKVKASSEFSVVCPASAKCMVFAFNL